MTPGKPLEVSVRASDGVELATTVHLPRGRGPVPAVLIRTPYDRTGIEVEPALRAGFAVAVQDCRGRYASGGQFSPFRQEIPDGTATAEWCVSQPWCDGRVVWSGTSYEGVAALLGAVRRPAGLAGVGLRLVPDDVRDGWMYEQGLLSRLAVQGWATGLVMSSQLPDDEKESFVSRLGALEGLFARPVEDAGLEEHAPWSGEWIRPDAPLFDEVRVRRRSARLGVPGFHVAGWFDPFCEGTIANARRMTGAGAPQRLLVGPWVHLGLFGSVAGDVDFGPVATGDDVPGEQYGWLRAALDGAAVETGARVFLTGAGEWREIGSWPPPARRRRLHLAGHGALTARSGGPGGASPFRHDPAAPVPTLGGRGMGAPAHPGVYDQAPIEARDDVLVFTSEPLEEPLDVFGMVDAALTFSSSAGNTAVVMKLCDVDTDGRSWNVVGAGTRVSGPRRRRWPVELRLGSVAHVFAEGHRLRLQVASSDHPRLEAVGPAADQAVWWGEENESWVRLPVWAAG